MAFHEIAAVDILFFFFFFSIFFSERLRHVISCESSARQTIHMKCQVLFSLKNNINTCNQNVVCCICA